MAYSIVRYTGNGTTASYTFPFAYISADHVKVKVDGTDAVFTFLNANTVTIAPTPAVGSVIEIKRVTPKDNPPVNFTDGSVLLERDLDLLATYDTYIAQESADRVDETISLDSTGRWDGQAKRLGNIAPALSDDEVVIKGTLDYEYPAIAAVASNRADISVVANDLGLSVALSTDLGSITEGVDPSTPPGTSAIITVAENIAAIEDAATHMTDIQNAPASATAAAASAAAAATSETNAASSATSASSSAASALSSKNAAATSETNAAASESSAASSALTATGQASAASGSASAAASSASSAGTAATQAASSASAASTSATNAASSANSAASSATSASSSAGTATAKAADASTAASNAASSATAASNSATAAAGSATAAAGSATTATTQASNASTSATSAASSATAASGSASAAATSATNAATSATNAANSATAAATSATNAANSATLAASYTPSQTGQSGNFLTTDGTVTSWTDTIDFGTIP